MRPRTKVVIAVGAAFVVLAGASAIILGHGGDGTGSIPTNTTGTLPTGTDELSVIRPFAPEVAWNRPVSEFGRSDKYAEYAERFWKYSGFPGWDDPTRRGDIDVEFRSYSAPIYDARLATSSKRAFIANFGHPPYDGYNIEVPWNDEWESADGNDAVILSVNPDTGEHWSVWAYQKNNPSTCLSVANLANGFTPFRDICVGGAKKLTNEDGSDGDYRTWNSVMSERGMGVPKLAMITTPYEVRSGVIEHALEMTVFNTMFGPPCSDAEADTDAAGSTCGIYLPPATRVEWRENAPTGCGQNNQPSTAETRRKTVPEGMRFALDISDDDIEAWLDERGYDEPLRSTARIFAVALRDYGWIIAETGCSGTSIQVDGMVNPAARKIWESLGVVDRKESDDILDGLFTEDRIYVVNPPAPVASSKAPNPGRAG